MRVLISILLLLFVCTKAYCQIPVNMDDGLIKDDSSDDGPFSYSYELAYSKAVGLYEKGFYAKAEAYFRKAFKIFPNEYAAQYIYYALIFQGRDLEAGDFMRRHRDIMNGVPRIKKGLESLYLDAGPRIAVSGNAGNLYYSDIGGVIRLSEKARLWQSVTWLQQDETVNSVKQWEYFASIPRYVKKGWTITPSVHYAHASYSSQTTETKQVSYDTTVYISHDDTLFYHTKAAQKLNYTIPGIAHYINISLAISKRLGAFVFEAEPALHYSVTSSNISFIYNSAGTTDSNYSGRNAYAGSKPFSRAGSGGYDTTETRYTGQIGLAVNYRLPIKHEPVSLRLAGYYLFDNAHQTSFAWYFYSLAQLNKNYWLHVNCLSKRNLPFALNNEGLYFNFNHEIEVRAGVSMQFRPLKRFSPVITYQFEQDERFEDDAVINYHSCYITLKYRL